jgi:hypothetical protein
MLVLFANGLENEPLSILVLTYISLLVFISFFKEFFYYLAAVYFILLKAMALGSEVVV